MYDKIVKIISQYEEKGDFTHPNVDDKDLYDAEKILNLKIPEQYVWFLKNYGHGGLDGIETYIAINRRFAGIRIFHLHWDPISG